MEDKVIEQNSVEQASREATVRRIRETFNEIYARGRIINGLLSWVPGIAAVQAEVDKEVRGIHDKLEYLAFKLKPWLPELEDPDSPLFQVTEQEIEEELAKHNDER